MALGGYGNLPNIGNDVMAGVPDEQRTISPEQKARETNTPYTPDGMPPELAALLESLVQPPPKALTRTQKIGAGLMRLGSGLSGGDPSMQSGAEMDYARQAQQATEQNTQTRRGLIGDEVRRREQDKRDQATQARQDKQNEAMLARQEQAQAAIEARQKALDDQNNRQADHSAAMKQLGDVIGMPGFELPPGEDIGKLTGARMMDLAYQFMKTRTPETAGFAAAAGALIAGGGRVSSVTGPIPGGGQMTVSGAPTDKPTLENAPVSESAGKQLVAAGGTLSPGMTNMDALNQTGELARKKAEQDAKDRQARLNKTGMGRGGNSVMKEIVSLGRAARAAQAAIDMQEDSGRTIGGAYGAGGIGSKSALMIQDSIRGTDFLAKRMIYEALLSNSIRGELFGEGGKNLTEIEMKILRPGAEPDMISLPESVQIELLTKLKRDALQAVADRKRVYGLSDDDIDGILSQGDVPSDPLPGMKIDPITVREH